MARFKCSTFHQSSRFRDSERGNEHCGRAFNVKRHLRRFGDCSASLPLPNSPASPWLLELLSLTDSRSPLVHLTHARILVINQLKAASSNAALAPQHHNRGSPIFAERSCSLTAASAASSLPGCSAHSADAALPWRQPAELAARSNCVL